MKKKTKIDNPEWRKYYEIILWWMNEKFYEQNCLSGYLAHAVRKSIEGDDEYYTFGLKSVIKYMKLDMKILKKISRLRRNMKKY